MVKQALPAPHKYLRAKKKFPSVWCPGCGVGIVLGAIIRAIDQLGLKKDEIAMLSGIGCAGRMPVYVDFNTVHATHGRALAFATGLKLARPEMKVIVVMGDGDALAIGGNHFIHACRRNLDMTAIVVNNSNYGMTGGQLSPTTPRGDMAVNAPYGSLESPFDTAKLAEAAGASYVARSTAYHVLELEKLVAQGMAKKGFAVVEALSPCPVFYGRLNKVGDPAGMLLWFRDHTSSNPEAGKIQRGVLVDRDIPEYLDQYTNLWAKATKTQQDNG